MSRSVQKRERRSEALLRLLIWRTGNGTEGSNPSLSANVLIELLLGFAGAFECCGRSAGLQLGVEHDLHHPVLHSEYEHARMKALGFDLGGDFEEGQRSAR